MTKAQSITILSELQKSPTAQRLHQLIKLYPKNTKDTFSKSELLEAYRTHYQLLDPNILKLFKKKPIRTLSGVTPVTVLTKPYPCPGECIFCPVDVRMPKSYIASEPGAARAAQNGFDPYLQVYNRLKAFYDIGHPISKIELIVLGGTWSVYNKEYQLWFIARSFEALNDFSSQQDNRPSVESIDLNDSLPNGMKYNDYVRTKTHEKSTWDEVIIAQKKNEFSACRCVGLVLETRPDYITDHEVTRLRRLGATKIQIGIQSLSDEVLSLNKRGHSVKQTKEAISKLRLAGFKIHAHWMPNLYGSNPENDKLDFDKLFNDPSICPDELKVYPCSLIEKTELMNVYESGKWQPYSSEELSGVLVHVLKNTPEYCRLTRIIRDIPGPEIVTGNKITNFRQILEANIDHTTMHDIRSREIKNSSYDINNLVLDKIMYETAVSTEYFLQYITKERKIAAFLRLSLPKVTNFIDELQQNSIIREVHVYGQSLSVGKDSTEVTQHQGLGKRLIEEAKSISSQHNYKTVAVISAIGTREYYRHLGFTDGILYQHLTSQKTHSSTDEQ
jgi:elongator complex protein 3